MARPLPNSACAIALVIAGVLALSASAVANPFLRDGTQFWTVYRNVRFGFSLTYPSGLLAPDTRAGGDAGRKFVSIDGRTTLLAGATRNEGEDTLESYRRLLINENYASARFDYLPVRRDWFVLSGELPGRTGKQIFYERVTFSCDGRYIYGWRLTYPAAERAVWDRVVEGIHRSFRPGRGDSGLC